MRRRDFLKTTSLSIPAVLNSSGLTSHLRAAAGLWSGQRHADVLIIGGGLGGCAAALSAAGAGRYVVMTEETEWIGGQLTSQAVPPDENEWIESHGASASYQLFRKLARDFYRNHYRLTQAAAENRYLNPGDGMVSRLCLEPRVALSVLYQMLAPFLSNGRLEILLNHQPESVEMNGDTIRAVTARDTLRNELSTLTAPLVIDATESGDLLPLSRTEFVTGFESQAQTGEPHAPPTAKPDNMQAATWCFPVQYVDGEDNTIDKPSRYEFWRDYVPALTPAWPGRLFDWSYSNPMTLKPRTLEFDPMGEAAGWWQYRRIVNHRNFLPGEFSGSITLVNWPQNDFLLGNFCEVSPQQLASHRDDAKQLSLSFLYWMQVDAPRPNGGHGWPGLKLMPSQVGTRDGLAMAPYIRESRRIQAKFTVKEQHVSRTARQATAAGNAEIRAEQFSDSVGIGHYRIDLHPSTGGDNYIDLDCLPFQIPLGALLPVRVRNLIAGSKNLGVTHITNGCYRLHPVEWNTGEAAGLLAAQCSETGQQPAAIYENDVKLKDFQRRLQQRGVRLAWP